MTETPVAESTISGTQPEGLSVWIVAEGSDEGMPDLGTVEQLSIRRFESLDALIEALDPDGEKRPDCIALVGCEPLGRTVRGLRDLAPETAVIVWSRRRDKVQVAQALASGAQIFSTDTRVTMLAPRIRDAVARQRRSVSHRNDVESRIAGLEREKQRLISLVRSVSSALDRDLTALLGHLDQAFDHLPESSDLTESLDMIDACGSRASELAQELAAYTGSRRVVPEPFDISELAEEMQVLLRACLAPGHELTLNPGFNLPLVEADRAVMRRLVVDLVLYVAQSPAAGLGVLTLSTGARECDRELLQEILGGDGMRTGRFVYLEASVDAVPLQRASGSGIGLEKLDGLEQVLREHYGGLRRLRGDRRLAVQAFLPAFDRSADDDVPIVKGWHDGGSILLIEPNALARASVIPTLERLGFDVETAVDGQEALKRLSDHDDFVLVIVDADLTQPTTETLVDKIQSRHGETKILISSGRGEGEVMRDFAQLGVEGFLRKPFRVVNLRRIFRRVLSFDDGSGEAQDAEREP